MLDDLRYVPTLAIRPSEIKALSELHKITKKQLTPCFLMAPWSSSNDLTRAIEKILEAYPDLPFILDIDRSYVPSNHEREVVKAFSKLSDPTDCYSNWFEFVKDIPNAIPCLQFQGLSSSEVSEQVERFRQAQLQFCLRICRQDDRSSEMVIEVLADGSADFLIILEGGWVKGEHDLQIWFKDFIDNRLERLHAGVPIVISYTSIPEGYAHMDGIARVQFDNHQVFSSFKTNMKRLIYGDWASTRPRTYLEFARRPRDRIDFATKNAWYFSRSQKEKWDFIAAAKAMISIEEFKRDAPPCWGTEMIKRTAAGAKFGIDSAQKNVASRINMHLHHQAFLNDPAIAIETFDEDYEE